MILHNKYKVSGGKRVFGEIATPISKNAILPIMAASIICQGKTLLKSCPDLTDIDNMILLLEKVGAKVVRDGEDIEIDASEIVCGDMSEEISSRFRSSIFMLGALISRCRYAKVSQPGGCAIGLRSIDIHLEALKRMGVVVKEEDGYVICDGTNMHGADIYLRYGSVGATENIIMASVLLKGKTRIINCACEPEIVDLQNFLNKCGAKISGAGTSFITITGVERLYGTQYTAVADRIVAGTYLCFGALNKGKLCITNINPKLLSEPINVLKQMGCDVLTTNNAVKINAPTRLNSINMLRTNPYPEFPTDLQSLFMSMLAISKGDSIIEENVFENRFHNAHEINKLGGDIIVQDKLAIIHGVKKLKPGHLIGSDLRGTMGLILLASAINGVSTIDGAQYVERGYGNFEQNIAKIGIDIVRL
ncbi:MAG: UDP-N-acetylglucosamine 1-carboxyvinyltransferase [Clostridia bacterium]